MATILVVDDDPRLVQFVGQHLEAHKHKCVKDLTGKKVLDLLEEHPVDLLVLDVMIPDCSGFEICRKIRSIPKHFSLPILFLSSMNGEEEVQHGLAQGADDYLGKPFQIEMLMRRIDMLLAQTPRNALNDPHTNQLSATGIKRVIQKHLNDKDSFSLIYAELCRISPFIKATSIDSREKAVRHFARALGVCAEEHQSEIYQIGHLGNGHFVVAVESNLAESFAQRANTLWEKHLPKLYSDLKLERQYQEALDNPAKAKVPILHAMFCIIAHSGPTPATPAELFESLNHLRQHALDGDGRGVYNDRRHSGCEVS